MGTGLAKDKPLQLQGPKQLREPAHPLRSYVYEHVGMHQRRCRRRISEQQEKEGVSLTQSGRERAYSEQ